MSSPYETQDRSRDGGAHPVNIGHLVMAVALLGLVGVWALWQGDVADGDDLRWLMPVPWVAAGLTGLTASALTSGRRQRERTRQQGWVGQDAERDLTSEAEPFTAEPTTQQTENPAAQPSAPPTVPPASPKADQQ